MFRHKKLVLLVLALVGCLALTGCSEITFNRDKLVVKQGKSKKVKATITYIDEPDVADITFAKGKVCAVVPKKRAKTVRVKPRCYRSDTNFAPGDVRSGKFKIIAKKKAKPGKFKIRFIGSGPGPDVEDETVQSKLQIKIKKNKKLKRNR